jgi:hypothetical protein
MLDTKPYEKTIGDWHALLDEYHELSKGGKSWVFRGQKRSKWGLQTSLERAILAFGIAGRSVPEDEAERARIQREILSDGLVGRDQKHHPVVEVEKGLLRRFMRQCYHYTLHTPEADNVMEWLALMQHYGAPTRLLDCTYSFFAAVYFALEDFELEDAEGECAVWALNSDWIAERVGEIAPEMYETLEADSNAGKMSTFEKLFWGKEPRRVVYKMNPYRLNERLVIQQGVFLCPGDVSIPFEDNLAELLSEHGSVDAFTKFKINVDSTQRYEILQHLHRMNMNRATLFPGLDGSAQSLRTLLAFPDMLRYDEHWLQDLRGT